MKAEPEKFPMRINKYLAHRGIATRKDADKLIARGGVFINGTPAELGDKVGATDTVTVKGKAQTTERLYFAYNKPRDIVTTTPTKHETDILKATNFPKGVFPVGRLDKDSEGLIIMTSDGRITDRLLNPDRDHEKEYEVSVNLPLTQKFLERMASGVIIDNNGPAYTTKPARLKRLGEKKFSIILSEGKNRQIRRMCEVLGYNVNMLKRVRIMNILLGKLKKGDYREIKGEELRTFLKSLGL